MSDLSDAVIGTKIKMPKAYSSGADVVAVTSVTKTQVVCGDTRLRKSDGLVIGSSDGWCRRYASVATGGDFLQARLAVAASRLREIKVTAENIDVIEGLLRG